MRNIANDNGGRVVEDIELKPDMSVRDMVEAWEKGGGFSAKKLAVAVRLLREMIEDRDMSVFLSFPACIVSTGTRGVIKEMVKSKMVDVIITTAGTVDHDLARVWAPYYHGRFEMDDKDLHRRGINRLGNVLVPNESYGIILEEKLQPMLEDIYSSGKKRLTTHGLCHELGVRLEDDTSILYWAAKNEIPVFIPGIMDGAIGAQIWMFWQTHKDFTIDVIQDEHDLSYLVYEAKSTGALMIGGGISKHHTIWWNQFIGGLEKAVYITTAVEYDGSLSGARIREAVSWGKVRENARYITVEGDATVIFPLMIAALL